jgi:prophage maintenance system killer protein
MTDNKKIQGGEIIIYRSKDGKAELEVKLKEETVWLTQAQLSLLFGVERSVVTKHLNNIFKSGELVEKRNVQFLHIANSDKPVKAYNLDVTISLGYRVNSKRATQFRIWATSVLKEHILKGYTLNQKRLGETGLQEFEQAVSLIKRTIKSKVLTGDESKGLLEVITTYASTWVLLQKYDQDSISDPKTKKSRQKFDYEFCRKAIDQIKAELTKKNEATDLFGNERGQHFKGIVGNIQQTFDKQELYPSIEEKAAHLLYFVIKDHPFSDGNKRIGSFLFIVFLAKTKYLYNKNGERKINDNALTALALLIAESDPKHKSLMIRLVMHFLSENKHE